MLYNIIYPLTEHWFKLFKYITFRSIGAVLTALLLSFIVGPWLIRWLQRHQQPIREDGPERHLLEKGGTPTMGGTLILLALVVPTLLWADLTNPFIWMVLITTLSFGAIGLRDDWLKVSRNNSKGMGGSGRFLLQTAIAVAMVVSLRYVDLPTSVGDYELLYFPFFKNFSLDLGYFYIPFAAMVIVGSANAVNLTDGLDGLAIGPTLLTAATFAFIVYLVGHVHYAKYLGIPYVAGTGELTVFCGAMVGAALGFLWFNTYPAQVFMGDVGSLSLGAALGSMAVISRHEIVLLIVGGVFVMETLSVIVQVVSFKLRGRRVFRMAPIHHHYELKGWAEPKIIVRFWIISVILALIGLATLKIR